MLLVRPLSSAPKALVAHAPGPFEFPGVWLSGLDGAARALLAARGITVTGDAAVVQATQLQTLGAEARAAGALALAEALERYTRTHQPLKPATIGRGRFHWGSRTFIMGVLNVTPDSFSDGGRYVAVEAARAQARAMAQAGADLIDVGGESTRPGAPAVSLEQELERVIPVVSALAKELAVPISVDTSKPKVAEEAVAAGATLVNDVTAFADPAMASTVAKTGAYACLMHMQGTPRTMQQAPAYDDVVGEVVAALDLALQRAREAGVAAEKLMVDPGIGFGKTLGHNLFLLQHLATLRQLGVPVVAGTSRKSFLGTLTGEPEASRRVVASAVSAALMAAHGAVDVVRVHDVAETVAALKVAEAVRHASDGGTGWKHP